MSYTGAARPADACPAVIYSGLSLNGTKTITGSRRCGSCEPRDRPTMSREIYIERNRAASLRTPTSTVQFLTLMQR